MRGAPEGPAARSTTPRMGAGRGGKAGEQLAKSATAGPADGEAARPPAPREASAPRMWGHDALDNHGAPCVQAWAMAERERAGRPEARGWGGRAMGREKRCVRHTKLRGPLVFHTWTVVDRGSGSRGPLFFHTWTVADRKFLKKKSFKFYFSFK